MHIWQDQNKQKRTYHIEDYVLMYINPKLFFYLLTRLWFPRYCFVNFLKVWLLFLSLPPSSAAHSAHPLCHCFLTCLHSPVSPAHWFLAACWCPVYKQHTALARRAVCTLTWILHQSLITFHANCKMWRRPESKGAVRLLCMCSEGAPLADCHS